MKALLPLEKVIKIQEMGKKNTLEKAHTASENAEEKGGRN
jgi:hypothetical protein